MKKFFTLQINKILTAVKTSQESERNESFMNYRFSVFDVTFAKSQSILKVLTDLLESFEKDHKDKTYSALWLGCSQANDFISLIEKKGKKESFIHYRQHILDIEIEKLNSMLNLILEKIDNIKIEYSI
jgi:hypothetical protein